MDKRLRQSTLTIAENSIAYSRNYFVRDIDLKIFNLNS